MYKKLEEIANITTGKLNANMQNPNGKYPFFTCASQPAKIDTYAFEENAILLAGNNANGTFHLSRYNGKFNAYQRTYVITSRGDFDIDYIAYSIRLYLEALKRQSQGTQTKFLTIKILNNIKIQSKTKELQIKTIQGLKNIDNKISLNNSIISKLEEMAKMIYEYWFLQFDFPNHEGKPYASSGGAMKYSEELGREIPTDWEVENFYQNSLFSLVPTGVEKFSSKCYLATADIVGTSIGEGKQVEYETRETRANMQPRINSVWFAKMKNSTKHLFLNEEMGFLIENYILSTGFFGLQCSKTSFEYIASTISYPSFEIKKDSLAHGATQEAVNQDDLQSIKLLIPNTFVLEKFHELTKPLYGYISQMRHENQKLTQLRDWLLPMLMNGQVRVE